MQASIDYTCKMLHIPARKRHVIHNMRRDTPIIININCDPFIGYRAKITISNSYENKKLNYETLYKGRETYIE